MNGTAALLRVLDQLDRANDERGVDVIDGVKVRDAAGDVRLEEAFSPVLPHAVSDYDFDPPQPVEVIELGAGRYGLVKGVGKDADYESVSAEMLKPMRARYLLLRGHYYRHLRNMDRVTRERVLAWYFPEGVWLPEEGSALAKAMGL